MYFEQCFIFCSNRKRKTSTSSLTNGVDSSKLLNSSDSLRSDTIALGTSSGSILIYSLKSGDVVSNFSKESSHNGRVNDIVSRNYYKLQARLLKGLVPLASFIPLNMFNIF